MKSYPVVGVIDMGTNTFHLIIAKVFPTRFEILYKEKIAVRIGEGGIDDDIIVPAAEQRAIEALKSFRKRLDEYGVETVRAMATSAFRNASNSQEIKAHIKRETQIEVEVINGLQEARYIYQGVKHSLTFPEGNSLIIDIGGGSVEFIICNANEVLWEHSFEIGGLRLVSKFHKEDPISATSVAQMSTYFDSVLTLLLEKCEQFRPQTLVGASGSFDTLIDIYQHKLHDVHYSESHKIPKEVLIGIIDELSELDKAARLAVPGMIEMRVNMIVVAGQLIKYICNKLHVARVLTSSFALKEGVLFEERDRMLH